MIKKVPHSSIFYTGLLKKLENAIKDQLNSQEDFLTLQTSTSPRAVGDAMQAILTEIFPSILGDLCRKFENSFERRAMADFAFTDKDGFYIIVDVKTHRVGTKFNMPNLTSVARLAKFYETPNNYFSLLLIKYSIKGVKVKVESVHFVPIEFLAWECLTLGALGWGQIQIADSNKIIINEGYLRKDWMLELSNRLLAFYPNEIKKIKLRLIYFEKVKTFWAGISEESQQKTKKEITP